MASPDEVAGVAVTLLAGSEILSLLPGVRANGWIQLLIAALQGIAAATGDAPRRPTRKATTRHPRKH